MGTTLVMGLPIAHQMYITHVGDSRAYWITRHGCYQVTLDDDVASREVRLGYAVYREAVQQGGAGSLIQALGMSPSSSLHPTSQRFILDEDGVFLLTSDGLTDYDRVEESWETEILPILAGETDVANVAERLVEIANNKNGHDNVTIALIHYQVKYVEPGSSLSAIIPERFANNAGDTVSMRVPDTILDPANQKTKVIPENRPRKIFHLPLELIVPSALILIVGLAVYAAKGQIWPSAITQTPASPSAAPSPNTTVKPSTTPTVVIKRSLANLAPGWVIKTTKDTSLKNVEFLPETFFKVIQKKTDTEKPEKSLVDLQQCSTKKEKFKFDQSQLKTHEFAVLQADEQSPCNNTPPTKSPSPKAQNDNSVIGQDDQ